MAIGVLGHSVKTAQEWTTDKALLREKIDGLTVSHGSGGIRLGLAWALKKLKEKAVGEQITTEVYVFSDMQVRTWTKGEAEGGERSARGLLPRMTELGQVFLAGTGGAPRGNLFVTDFVPVDKILAKGVTTEFRVVLETANLAAGKKIAARLTLYVNDEKRHFERLEVPAEGKVLRLPYKVLTSGEQLVRVVVDGDDSPLDNERLYLAEIPEAVKILVIDDAGDLPAHERNTVFWEYAIAPPAAPGREPVSAFTARTCTWKEAQKENFGDYGAVVLANVAQPSEGLISRLTFYVREGGNLLTFAGEGIEPYPYEKLYLEGRGPLPVTFKDRKETAAFLRPLLPGAGNLEEGAFRFFRQLSAGNGGDAGPKVIARLSTGQPLVVSQSFGRGRSLVMAMDPGLKWSMLPLAVDYPVFVQELLRAVLGDPNRLVNLSVGDTFSQPVLISAQHILLKTPDKRKIRITPQVVEGQNTHSISFSDTDVRGVYQLAAPPGVLARTRFAVNLNPEEGDMTMWTEDDLERIADDIIFLSPSENITKRVESMHALREFAGIIMFLVFLLMLLESFLAMRFGLRKG